MSFQYLIQNGPILLFAFARIAALIFTAPLLNSRAIPVLAKGGLALALAFVTIPYLIENGYVFPESPGMFFLLLFGEILIGITMSLIIMIYHTVFQVAGQLFTTQIGFSATQVFDPMGQVEMPLIGQFFNLAGMYLFLSIKGFNKLFTSGIYHSFKHLNPSNFFTRSDFLNGFFLESLGRLFSYSMQIAFPIIATLMIMSFMMGLLSKAAPQMNLLMLGFPLNIGVGFLVMILLFPVFLNFFIRIFETSFVELFNLFGMGVS